MSDPGDKTRQKGGPLPRTNRPRPEAASRRGRREHPTPDPSRTAPPTTLSSGQPSEDAPKTDRERETPAEGIEEAPRSVVGNADDRASQIAEHPTLLAVGNEDVTRPGLGGPLKHVPLVRADGTLAPEDDVGPSSTYVGCVVDGRYRIEGVLGRGGMGVVYRARHEVIDKIAAIKILLPTEDGDVVERFVNEARAATAIGNAHIVDTVDFGELPDGSTYFVMEYLEGETLARRIKRDGVIAVPRAIAIAKQIAEGMSAAHRAGIVHRDLKPENIFITRRDGAEDFVKLLDFGIAKMAHSQNRITRAGTIFGTPHYMSPEQASGAEVDPRTDVYSLGIILYEMFSGSVPFDAENPMGLLTQHMYTEPVPLARRESQAQPISSALDAVVLKCLAKKPDDRYASMTDFAADIDRADQGEPPVALADLLARAEREHDEGLIAAAKQELRRTPQGRGRSLVLAATGIGAMLVGVMLVVGMRPVERVEAGPKIPVATVTPAPKIVSSKHAVALVFSPIDAEVFYDGKSLGGMPVTIPITPGTPVNVEIRRDGFYPEPVRLDGSRGVVVVRLTAIPGVQPRIPVPKGEPLEALRRGADAGVHAMAAPLLNSRNDSARAHADAGTARAVAATPPTQTPPNAGPAEPSPPGPSPALAPSTAPTVVAPPPATSGVEEAPTAPKENGPAVPASATPP